MLFQYYCYFGCYYIMSIFHAPLILWVGTTCSSTVAITILICAIIGLYGWKISVHAAPVTMGWSHFGAVLVACAPNNRVLIP